MFGKSKHCGRGRIYLGSLICRKRREQQRSLTAIFDPIFVNHVFGRRHLLVRIAIGSLCLHSGLGCLEAETHDQANWIALAMVAKSVGRSQKNMMKSSPSVVMGCGIGRARASVHLKGFFALFDCTCYMLLFSCSPHKASALHKHTPVCTRRKNP